MPRLSVVVPAYNEAENIPILMNKVDKALSGIDCEIIIVDDGSVDNTAEVARNTKTRCVVKVLRHSFNRGKTAALITGIQVAEGEYITFLDADMEYPPEALPIMFQEALRGRDLVVAVRVDPRPFHRRVISSGARILAKILIPKLQRYKDPTSEMVLVKRDLIQAAKIKPKYIKPFIPLLLIAKYPGEVLIKLDTRKKGETSFKIRWIIMYIYELIDLIVSKR